MKSHDSLERISRELELHFRDSSMVTLALYTLESIYDQERIDREFFDEQGCFRHYDVERRCRVIKMLHSDIRAILYDDPRIEAIIDDANHISGYFEHYLRSLMIRFTLLQLERIFDARYETTSSVYARFLKEWIVEDFLHSMSYLDTVVELDSYV